MLNPFPQIPETKSRLWESLGARFPETKSGVKNEILILGTSGSAFSGNEIRTPILDNYYNFYYNNSHIIIYLYPYC